MSHSLVYWSTPTLSPAIPTWLFHLSATSFPLIHFRSSLTRKLQHTLQPNHLGSPGMFPTLFQIYPDALPVPFPTKSLLVGPNATVLKVIFFSRMVRCNESCHAV
jgi:hypothetical protein